MNTAINKKYESVYEINTAVGGYELRIRSNGERCIVETLSPRGTRWTVAGTMSIDQFDRWVERNGYNNPGALSRLIDSMKN